MLKAKKLIALLFAFAVLSGTAFACTGYNSLDLIRTDSVILQNSNGSGDETCYSINIDFDVPTYGFQTALSVSNFYNYKPAGGFDYSVRGGQRGNSRVLAISVLVDDRQSWTKLAVSYFVTARNDVFAGSFFADGFSQFDCSATGDLQYTFTQNLPAIPANNYNVLVFIAGLETKDNIFDFAFKKQAVFRNGVLEVKASSNAFPHIENVLISYVIYRANAPLTISILPAPAVSNQDYAFLFTNSFFNSNADIFALTFDSDRLKCTGPGCKAPCTTVAQCGAWGGVVVGKECILCLRNQRIENKQCVNNCKVNEDWINEDCVCKPGYVKDSQGQCNWACGPFQEWIGRCACRKDCGKIKGKCQVCPENSRANNQQCVCNQDYYWNERTEKCEYFAPCPINSKMIFNGTSMQCKCDPNYYWVEPRQCVYVAPCGPNGYVGTKDIVTKMPGCVCDVNYMWNEPAYRCDYLKACTAYSSPKIVNGKWTCVCDKGYRENVYKGTCEFISNCPAYSTDYFNGTDWICKCNDNYYYNKDKQCCDYVSCPSNSAPWYDDSNKIWKWRCNDNYYYNKDRTACIYLAPCPPRSKPGFDGDVFKCICDADYYWNSAKAICDYVPSCNGPYNEAVFINGVWTCGCRKDCYYSSSKNCKPYPICPSGAKFNELAEECQCFVSGQYMIDGLCKSCGENEEYHSGYKKFVCKAGYTSSALGCIKICNEWEEQSGKLCVCKSNCYLGGGKCTPCPDNMRPSGDRTGCVCIDGYTPDAFGKCAPIPPPVINKCPEGMEWTGTATGCRCKANHYMEAGICKPNPVCPIKSKWNQAKLRCECTVVNENLIDGQCVACKERQAWNGKECACKTGWFKINGECLTCDPNSYYNGNTCICNIGFFGVGKDKCNKCHATCAKCTGPLEHQCTMCSDVSYTLKKGADGCGLCTRNNPCPIGLYNDKGDCKPCSSYCSECESENVCKSCISGFELNEMQYDGLKYSYCVEICGDGKRFELDCDDGNRNDGDGCSFDCQVEKGYHCQGGSSIKPSTCVKFIPSRSFVTLTGTVHLFGRIVQGVRLSYIPPELTANDCMNCHKLLWVRVISSSVVPGVRVNYLPKSQYQFMTEFDFNGLFAIPVFTISIQINPDYAKYFNDADLAQIQVKAIDPAVLAKKDTNQELKLEQVYNKENSNNNDNNDNNDNNNNNKIAVDSQDMKTLFPENKPEPAKPVTPAPAVAAPAKKP